MAGLGFIRRGHSKNEQATMGDEFIPIVALLFLGMVVDPETRR